MKFAPAPTQSVGVTEQSGVVAISVAVSIVTSFPSPCVSTYTFWLSPRATTQTGVTPVNPVTVLGERSTVFRLLTVLFPWFATYSLRPFGVSAMLTGLGA